VRWCKDNDITDIVKADEMHVTIAFSKKKISWSTLTTDDSSMDLDLENAKIQKL
jgi:hypothetical protein